MVLFSTFRVAPGVRVRLGPRGVRTSIGPRGARLHVGGGRPGISTGAGPFTLYRSIGGSGRRSPGRSRAADERRLREIERDLERQREAVELLVEVQDILLVHRAPFPPASPPVAPAPEPPDAAAIEARAIAEARRGIPWWAFGRRRRAREAAREAARVEVAALCAAAEAERSRIQADLDAAWAALCANDLDTVWEVVGDALADNGSWAAPADVDGDHIWIVMEAPPDDWMPRHMPLQHPDGTWDTQATTAAQRHELMLEFIAAHVLATAAETLAVAPGLATATVAVVRDAAPLGAPDWEVLAIAEITRERLAAVDLTSREHWPSELLEPIAELEVRFRANSARLLPLDPKRSPAAAAVLAALERDPEPDGDPDGDGDAADAADAASPGA